MKRIDVIGGARPNFMKIASIVSAFDAARSRGSDVGYRLVHTGQHYDRGMSAGFFEQLEIPNPDVNLEVGSGTQAEQTAAIMTRYEKVLLEEKSDLCLVVGDVNSTMACSITARKLNVKVAHVEAGLRSGDWTMPEEINRVVTDSVSDWFFTTSETAGENLRRSGVGDDRIFFVGNTMVDTLLKQMPRLRPPPLWDELHLKPGSYLVLTLHRPSNVDDDSSLLRTLRVIADLAGELPVVFPVHPRTAKHLGEIGTGLPRIHFVDPQPYLEFNYLVKHSRGVITDSGGITEETTVMGIPCLTLRDSTERPETVTIGTNEMVGTQPDRLRAALTLLLRGEWKKGGIPEKWDGQAGERIVSTLETLLSSPPGPR